MKLTLSPVRQFFRTGDWIQYWATFAGLLNIITSGMQYGWPSPTLPILQDPNNTDISYHVTHSEGSTIAVMNLVGAIIGSVAAGFTVDIIGRRNMITLSCFPFFISWVTIAASNCFEVTCLARFIAGLADGLILTAVPIYVCEISSAKNRGFLGSMIEVAYIGGMLLVNVLGSWCSIRLTALLGSINPVLCLVFIVWMPQSPYYLIMKDRILEARTSLEIFRGTKDVEIDFKHMINSVTEHSNKKSSVLDLIKVKSNRKAFIITLVLRAAQQFGGISPIMFYNQYIFESTFETNSAKIAAILFFAIQVAVSLVSSKIVDATGRRSLLILSCAASGVCLLIAAVYYHIDSFNIDITAYDYIPTVAIISYDIAFSVGLQTVPMLMMGELFPPDVKCFAVCFAELYACLLATLASIFFQTTSDTFGLHVPFYSFGAYCFLSVVLSIFVVPETKLKTLEEIQEDLKNSTSCI